MKLMFRSDQSIEIESTSTEATTSRSTARIALFWALSVFCASTSTFAAPGEKPLEITLAAERVTVRPDGSEELSEEGAAGPGDTLQYRATFSNKSGAPLHQLAPTLPIPQGTVLIEQSCNPAPREASLDGKKFEQIPVMRRDRNGSLVPVPTSAYRALRWEAGSLGAHDDRTVVARVKLVSSK